MSTYEDLKKHCESVPVNHMGLRIACVQADTILELITKVEAEESRIVPALPKPDHYYAFWYTPNALPVQRPGYSAEQMRNYAYAAMGRAITELPK